MLFIQLAIDKCYTKDLFVASYRYQNVVSCMYCECVYRSTFVDRLDETPIRMLSLFVQCLSLDGVTKDDYYNYV